MKPHIPVLLDEFLEIFQDDEITTFFDGTVGASGHSSAILEAHPEIETFIGCDVDPLALSIADENLASYSSTVRLKRGNFANLDQYLEEENIQSMDGFFFDVGLSSMQLADEERGFSFQKESPLDMRMDPTLRISAKEIVNRFSEKKLTEIFKNYGEEKNAKKAARTITIERKKKPIDTTKQLAEILQKVCRGKPHLHPATLVFQALRIYVNDELVKLEEAIAKALPRLSIGGKIGVISFHRLEDRIVKNAFREAAKDKKDPKFQILTKKPIIASAKERRENRRSRSAKMRFLERKK